jgi:hypothetical protein
MQLSKAFIHPANAFYCSSSTIIVESGYLLEWDMASELFLK